MFSGDSLGGSGGLLEPPSGDKLFHGKIYEKSGKLLETNPLHDNEKCLNLTFRHVCLFLYFCINVWSFIYLFILGHLISSRHHRSPLQIDLAPTLSVLMGLPIPNNNLGQVLQGVLEAGGLGAEAILDVLYINSQQIVQLMEANVPSYKSGMS